jgi:hypothetical protein
LSERTSATSPGISGTGDHTTELFPLIKILTSIYIDTGEINPSMYSCLVRESIAEILVYRDFDLVDVSLETAEFLTDIQSAAVFPP